MSTNPLAAELTAPEPRRAGTLMAGLAGLATVGLVVTVIWITVAILAEGIHGLSPGFLWRGVEEDMFDPLRSGVFPMIFGTFLLVLVMTVLVIPVGVLTAIYLHEYADQAAWQTKAVRLAVDNLAGIPSIVFGLFGLGFFVYFLGRGADEFLGNSEPIWGKPALLWASLTMAALTVPVVVVATEEALVAVPQALREASFALGASRLATLFKLVLPQALPGILTGGILAVSRGAGEVAPIMFTGAAYLCLPPDSLDDQFMELGYHIYVLATQSPDVEATRPILFATTVVLLALTFTLNLAAVIARARLRARYRQIDPNL